MKTIDELRKQSDDNEEHISDGRAEATQNALGEGEPHTIAFGDFLQGVTIRYDPERNKMQLFGWYDGFATIASHREDDTYCGDFPYEISVGDFLRALNIDNVWWIEQEPR